MAERVTDFEFGTERRGGATCKYPWDEWQDGSVWRIVHGEDFQPKPEHFRKSLMERARKTGTKVRTSVKDDTIHFQFYKPA